VSSALDLPDDCWRPFDVADPIRPGDLFDGVPFPSLEEEFDLYVDPEVRRVFLPVRFSFGLILRVYSGFVVLAPITSAADVPDPETFAFVIEQARSVDDFIRLPEFVDAWSGDALGRIYEPHTLPQSTLQAEPPRRLAVMTDEAATVLHRRLANAWS
jgi:hypothetical protein